MKPPRLEGDLLWGLMKQEKPPGATSENDGQELWARTEVTQPLTLCSSGASPVAQRLSAHVPLRWPGVRQFRAWIQTYPPLIKPCCGRRPTYRRRWAQMLAQSQSSLAKRGRLAADVSSGLIFQRKKAQLLTSLSVGQPAWHTSPGGDDVECGEGAKSLGKACPAS